MKTAFVINEGSGGSAPRLAPDELAGDWREALRRTLGPGPVSVVEGPAVAEEIEKLAAGGIDRVVVGGGDGTVGAAAEVAERLGLVLGILPLGTRNHFARDLGIPGKPAAALDWLAGASVRNVDVGEVNGRVFINNVSVGLYPHLVRERDKVAPGGGWGKTAATPVALARAVIGLRPMHLRLDTGGKTTHRLTPFLLVGNNVYSDIRSNARRQSLAGGLLWVCTAAATGRVALGRIAWRAWRENLTGVEDLRTENVRELTVWFRRRRQLVAIDGELCRLETPLRFRIRAGALRVMAR